MTNVVIVGRGAWGKALYKTYSAKFAINIESHSSEFDCLQLDYLFLVIPAQFVRDYCRKISNNLSASCKIIICSAC